MRVEGQSSREAYSLEVDPQGVRIVGASPAGVFYGLQSLRSLLPAPTPAKGLVLPALHVVDAPRFGYRGFMLDVARNFQPKAAGAAHARPPGPLQDQRLPLPPDRGRGLARRDPEPARAHGGGRAARSHARLQPLPASRVGLRAGRGPAVGQRLLHARRLRRDPALRGGAPHRGGPGARDAGPRARRGQGHGGPLPRAERRGRRRGRPALPAERPGRPLGVHLGAALSRQRDEPGARLHLRVHRARRRRSRGDPQRGGRALAQSPHGRRRGPERRLGALAGRGGLHEAARARERRRPLVRLLRQGRADPEGSRRPALRLGGDRRPQDAP